MHGSGGMFVTVGGLVGIRSEIEGTGPGSLGAGGSGGVTVVLVGPTPIVLGTEGAVEINPRGVDKWPRGIESGQRNPPERNTRKDSQYSEPRLARTCGMRQCPVPWS